MEAECGERRRSINKRLEKQRFNLILSDADGTVKDQRQSCELEMETEAHLGSKRLFTRASQASAKANNTKTATSGACMTDAAGVAEKYGYF